MHKLTEAQRKLLEEAKHRGSVTFVDYYRPGQILVREGYLEKSSSKFARDTYVITRAGEVLLENS